MEKEYYRKVMISLYRPVKQKKLYKYRRYIKNKLPYTYVSICKDKLFYKYFTEEGIARYLYDNYGYGTYMIQGWKWYSKCKKCKLSLNKKEYRKVIGCPTYLYIGNLYILLDLPIYYERNKTRENN